ncbi:Phytochrome A-associated F-box protein [Hibiscus syriacus]|uniref:Phytochrome A-associated F-box protein n=1 Tax=Hibiscus syriacus TaxID=106335 RepID=A0A6A2WG19_HIBSY|nr:phytochrome A-associated F-box protein-like [Hibiscus syriacus]KAE8657663.1 Phytochrome A-associated F-box protein [Hibiscus syriacus]
MTETSFSALSDDVVLSIFLKLEDDPKSWACIACVCTKFSSLIRNTCFKQRCSKTIPSVCADLFFSSSILPGGWASLHKLSVCCPGLHHAGVLLEHSDFGDAVPQASRPYTELYSSKVEKKPNPDPEVNVPRSDSSLHIIDDQCYDTVSNVSESIDGYTVETIDNKDIKLGLSVCKRRKISKPLRSHLAYGVWNLSRERGNKLLASRFRGDCLYICDWPGCIHSEEKRNYMLFRGIFKNFKKSHVWRTINDGNRNKTDLNCAFCSCEQTWDLRSAFCLRRVFGYHDDGEPVVRAYVCENGHVSGAWTDLPLYA